MLVSLVAAGIIWKWIYHTRFGPINQVFEMIGLPRMGFLLHEDQAMPSMAIINSWVRVGYSVLILQAGLQSIPSTIFDSASVDGASDFKLYRHIILPLLLPHITAVALLEIIFAVGAFDIIYVTTQGGPADTTRVIMLYLYDNAFRFNRPDKAAVVSVVIFVLLLIVGIVQRKFIAGKEYDY
jgi:multiple sugar transport system permease protein